MKKLFCILSCVCALMALCMLSASAKTVTGSCGDAVTYTLDTGSGVFTISGEGDMYHYGMENVPWINYRDDIRTVIINKGVTSIGNGAFHMCENLSKVTIPDSVTSIGAWVFTCAGIKRLTIPEGVTSIELNTFRSCEELESISLPDTLTYIGNHAFFDCKGLTSITIPSGVTTIKADTFFRCTSLQSVSLPKSLTTIEAEAFYKCISLKNIEIPDGVTHIGNSAFMHCESLEKITIPESVTQIGKSAFDNCSDKLIIDYQNSNTEPTDIPDHINENDSDQDTEKAPEPVQGDMDGNGELDQKDAAALLTAVADDSAPDGADMNGDGNVSLIDVLMLLKSINK